MFLEALKGKNKKRPPVWLMRQAGRYMPSYRALRKKHSLKELFFTPELAAQITLMPLEQLKVDAAILFSDITVVALPLGMELEFSEGPIIQGALQKRSIDCLEPIAETIRLVKKETKTPLIGFCGGPYTVSCYMGKDLSLLDAITEVSIEYIRMQEEAGVDAIQIFDSWAGLLDEASFQKYVTPYLKRLIDATTVPVTIFMRGACRFVHELVKLKPDAISFDDEKPLCEMRKQAPMAVQGNLSVDLLYQPLEVIEAKTKELLNSMKQDPAFIVNLAHGVKKDVSMEAVDCLIKTVQNHD